jgi:hypothetical protein
MYNSSSLIFLYDSNIVKNSEAKRKEINTYCIDIDAPTRLKNYIRYFNTTTFSGVYLFDLTFFLIRVVIFFLSYFIYILYFTQELVSFFPLVLFTYSYIFLFTYITRIFANTCLFFTYS